MIQKLNHKKKKWGDMFFRFKLVTYVFLSQTSKKWVKSFKFLCDFRNFFVFYEEKLGKLPSWAKKHEYQNYFWGFFLMWIKTGFESILIGKKKDLSAENISYFLPNGKLDKYISDERFHRAGQTQKIHFRLFFFSVFGNFTFCFYLTKHF